MSNKNQWLGVTLTISGVILIGIALITAALYVEHVDSWFAIIGRFGTAILDTGGFITVPWGIYWTYKGKQHFK